LLVVTSSLYISYTSGGHFILFHSSIYPPILLSSPLHLTRSLTSYICLSIILFICLQSKRSRILNFTVNVGSVVSRFEVWRALSLGRSRRCRIGGAPTVVGPRGLWAVASRAWCGRPFALIFGERRSSRLCWERNTATNYIYTV